MRILGYLGSRRTYLLDIEIISHRALLLIIQKPWMSEGPKQVQTDSMGPQDADYLGFLAYQLRTAAALSSCLL